MARREAETFDMAAARVLYRCSGTTMEGEERVERKDEEMDMKSE